MDSYYKRGKRIKKLNKMSSDDLKEIVLRDYVKMVADKGSTIYTTRDPEEYSRLREAGKVFGKDEFILFIDEDENVDIDPILHKTIDTCLAAEVLAVRRVYGVDYR